MDFFQGSSPPNFISFCLEHQNVDEPQVQSNTTTGNPTGPLQRPVPISMTSSVPSPPPFPPIRAVLSQTTPMAVDSPFSNESNIDVTTYADEMVQRMEISQGLIGDDLARHDEEGPFTAQVPAVQATIQDPEFVRSNTPNPSNQPGTTVVSFPSSNHPSQLCRGHKLTSLSYKSTRTRLKRCLKLHSFNLKRMLHLQSSNRRHFPGEMSRPKPQENKVTPIKRWKVQAIPKSLHYMVQTLSTLYHYLEEVANLDLRIMTRAYRARQGQAYQYKEKFCEICQDEVEQL